MILTTILSDKDHHLLRAVVGCLGATLACMAGNAVANAPSTPHIRVLQDTSAFDTFVATFLEE